MSGAAAPHSRDKLALWGGFECSVTRIGDRWRDQVRETGHHDRPQDIALAAAHGVTALRYPFVWERVLDDAQGVGGQERWPWHDARMARLRQAGLRVVAGLLHHGSGPAGTSLLDPDFPALLAVHAGRVAQRYPDIQDWTPVNEPLTTARFSCLYGAWYPHQRDEAAFLRATVAQCRAVLLAMRAIRRHSPAARLLQTEDLGRVFSTPELAAQARHENQRRWISLDLLAGHIDRAHPVRDLLLGAGVDPRHLDELATGEARPDLLGANHYVTSERFLDHRTALYPPRLRGGNGRQSYADTEAVRVPMPEGSTGGGSTGWGSTGWVPRLREAWERYRIPMVVGEAHLGCADEVEQARWFARAWAAALTLRAGGVDLQAVTAWALAGSVDWDSLMLQRRAHHELGAWKFGAAGPQPRLLAAVLRGLADSDRLEHPDLAAAGWWEREDRFHVQRRRA